ncbi:MAG: alpha/beta fold hydrolase [Longimicrobiales bacterium]|nr:alpha/beta fold hydrolase [Longimicrobiales bacterium]
MREDLISRAGRPAIRIRRCGVGRPVVLVHGFASGLEGWPRDGVASLCNAYHVILIDLPGHGGSAPATLDDTHPEAAVDALLSAVGAVTDIEAASWMGYSMGARLLLTALALGAPLRHLLLESANPGIVEPSERSRRAARDAVWAARFEREPLGSVLDDWLAQPIFATRAELSPSDRDRQRGVREAADGASLGAWLRGFGSGTMPPAWSALEGSTVPLDLLVGDRDLRYVELARAIERRRLDARIEIATGVGHAPHIEAPDVWTEWVAAALKEG